MAQKVCENGDAGGEKMITGFDPNLFYLFLSDAIIVFQDLVAFFNALYETQKYRFYDAAKDNSLYHDPLLSNGTLEVEVVAKRTFGILICSHDDPKLKNLICKEFLKAIPQMEALSENYSFSTMIKVFQKYKSKNWGFEDKEQGSIFFLMAYVLMCKQGLDSKNPEVQELYNTVWEEIRNRCMYVPKSFSSAIDRLKVHDLVDVPRHVRKTKDAITSGNCLTAFNEWTNVAISGDPHQSKTAVAMNDMLKEYIQWEPLDFLHAQQYCNVLADIMTSEGYSFSMQFNGERISKEEQDRVFKIAAKGLSLGARRKQEIQVTHYVVALLFYMLVKQQKECREFYFKNNSETQFNELTRAEDTIASLEEQLKEKKKIVSQQESRIAALEEQVDRLTLELHAESKESEKAYIAEIRSLGAQVKELQRQLDEESEKNEELNRLREFVFALQREEEATPSEELSLKEEIGEKSIYVFGGHPNWQAKLRLSCPSISIMNGHNTSFDEQQLQKADIVLFNTSNMSHKLYYKVINALRKNKTKFDYLENFTNQKLLEQEIAEVLRKHFRSE